MAETTPIPARERARDARRRALLEAAEEVFAEHGFDGATMAAIAARAGYSAGHLYNVFANKEALFREVVGWRGDSAERRILRALDEAPQSNSWLDAFVRASLAFFEENQRFFVFYIQTTGGFEWNAHRMGPEGRRVQETIERAVEGRIRQALERGQLPAGDPLVYSCIVLGTLHHYLSRWIQAGGSPEELWCHEAALRETLHRALGGSS